MLTVKGLELLYASVLDSQSPAELAEEFQLFQFSKNHHNMLNEDAKEDPNISYLQYCTKGNVRVTQ